MTETGIDEAVAIDQEVAGALTELMPVEAAERLGAHLTAGDVDTLRDLVRASVPDNTIRAVASDLAYLEAWSRAASGPALSWPPAEADGLKFIAHHLFRAEERRARREAGDGADDYGMPGAVEYALREKGVLRGGLPHAPATVSRRLSSWRRVAQVRGFEDALSSAVLRRALAAAAKASNHQVIPKSETAVTRAILDRLIGEERGASSERLPLRELRDRTLLLVAFATGGRRRSELGTLRIENIFDLDEGLGIRLGRTKTTTAGDGAYLIVAGRAKTYLQTWLGALAKQDPSITDGALFRSIDRWGRVGRHGLSGQAVNDILKSRAARAGLEPDLLSAHGLRSGYLTEASLQGVPIEAAMRHSMHRSYQTAVRYYHDQERASGKAAKLAG